MTTLELTSYSRKAPLLARSTQLHGPQFRVAAGPLYILSQIVGRFIITYLRAKLNFFWGVKFHSSLNFVFIFMIPVIE